MEKIRAQLTYLLNVTSQEINSAAYQVNRWELQEELDKLEEAMRLVEKAIATINS